MQPTLVSQIIPNLQLDITDSRSDSFSVIHWQCEASLKLENHALIVDDGQFVNRAKDFVRLAREKNSSLALAPEYSFPWELLDKIIENPEMQPSASKLWCFGMQYISLVEFTRWRANHNAIIVDDFTPQPISENSSPLVIFGGFRREEQFANILVYMFFSDRQLVLLLQSKLEHMRDRLYEFEASKLSLGNVVFLFDGDESSHVIFGSLICADAFQADYYDRISSMAKNRHILLFHPQCNVNPYHDTLITHINSRLDANWSFLRLNWSRHSMLDQHSMNALGTDYVYKGNDNIKDSWSKDTFRECYIKNRSKGLNLRMDNSWKCQWTFPWQEHLAVYFIKKPLLSSTVIHASNQLVVSEIYMYQGAWNICDLCPIKSFEGALTDRCSEHIADLKSELACTSSTLEGCCPLVLWDRFVSLCRGNYDYEIFLKHPRDKEPINHSITNLSKPHKEMLVKIEFEALNKIAAYLKNIVEHSKTSDDASIQTLHHLIPNGARLCVDRDFPQNKKTMYNLKGNPLSRWGALQEGLVVYTKDTLTQDLSFQLDEYSKKTEAKELGVLLFCPDGDNTVKLFPNPQWKHATDVGPHGASPISPSSVGVGGCADD